MKQLIGIGIIAFAVVIIVLLTLNHSHTGTKIQNNVTENNGTIINGNQNK